MDEKLNNIATILSVAGLVLAVFLVATANKPEINITPEGNEIVDTMSVSGLAELTVAPDQAIMSISINTEGATADEAQTANKGQSDSVIAALKAAGISEEDIETSNYYLYEKSEWDYEKERTVEAGYELRHTLKVTTTQIDSIGSLIDTAIKAGANGVSSISFGLQKHTEKEVRDVAMERAALAAKEKAKSIADSLGIKLGKITSVTESNFYYTPYEYTPNYARSTVSEDSMGGNSISPQKVDVTSSIGLVFEIN